MAADRMQWSMLLSDKRVRKLLDGIDPLKVEGESRTEFERDRDRTVYSTPFRRLIGKTQVYPLNPNDVVRTRLVHSMEVSTVAEGLASQVAHAIEGQARLSSIQLRGISKVAEAGGLLHDLGNPPFGHAGEHAIRSWFIENKSRLASLGDSQQVSDFLLFDGNPQAFRLVGNTHLLGHSRGLNLTAATMSAMCKYVAPSNIADEKHGPHEMSKPGYFKSEQELFDAISTETGTAGRRHPLSLIVEAADDIVNGVVDIEDAVKQRLLRWESVETTLKRECSNSPLCTEIIGRAHEQVGNLDYNNWQRDNAFAQAFRVNAVSVLVRNAVKAFEKNYDQIIRGEYSFELAHAPKSDSEAILSNCKRLLQKHVFQTQDILRLEVRGRRIIHDLMTLFWEGIEAYQPGTNVDSRTYPGKLYLLISSNHKKLFEQRLKSEDPTYCRLQLLVDFVSGMTDAYASRLHSELMNG